VTTVHPSELKAGARGWPLTRKGCDEYRPWKEKNLGCVQIKNRSVEFMVGAKSQAVQLAVDAIDAGQTFAITDLERTCPTVSRATIRRVLEQLREQGKVECLGTGRAARWQKC